MNLEQIFYTIGIVYMLSWLVMLLVIVAGLIILYFQAKRVKQQLQKKMPAVLIAFNLAKKLPWAKLASFLGLIPIGRQVIKMIKGSSESDQKKQV